MNVGYASKTLALPEGRIRSITKKQATDELLTSVIEHNLSALAAVLDYCHANSIHLYRISSDIIPFGSSSVNQLDWAARFSERFKALGHTADSYGIRLSMHPGQYTVLNSLDALVAERAVDDLVYHARVLDLLGTDSRAKIVLHVGGLYNDRQAAMERFSSRFSTLDDSVKRRLVVENDDRLFTAEDALSVAHACSIPLVFDVLHHRLNHRIDSRGEQALIQAAASTWNEEDGRQKIHYSQQAAGKKAGSHSDTIALDPFLAFTDALHEVSPDIMLEVKDKNISAVKCTVALDPRKKIGCLEREWARYKYSVLERDQAIYQEIRTLLKNKDEYPARPFYRLVEKALREPPSRGSACNAVHHVWGYVADFAEAHERTSFARLLNRYSEGSVSLDAVKRRLFALAERHNQAYLTHSYYFDLK